MTSGAKAQTGAKSTTSVTLAGDVTGPSSANTVAKINGSPLGTTTGATSGQYLAWNGSAWVPTTAAAGGVTSFNTRTGAVVPANADYLAVASGGLTGATAATRFVGGTANGAPASGTFAVGDFIVDQTSSIFVCVVAGTPGTWSSTISNHMTLRSATATAKFNEITLFTGSTASQTISAPASPIDSVTWSIINNSSVNVTLGFSSNAMYVLGANTSVTTYTVTPGSAYSFVNYNGGNWYMTSTNDLTNGTGVLPTSNGGTGLSTIGTAGQVLTVNSGATALQYSSPSVTMGGDVTGNSATSTVAKINGSPLGTTSGATTGQALGWSGSAWVPTTISGGAPGTTIQSFITSDVTLTTANVAYNITSISLTAGTWFISGMINFGNSGSAYNSMAISPTSASYTSCYTGQFSYAGNNSYPNIYQSCSVTLSSTTTVYLVAATNVGGAQVKASQTLFGNAMTNITGLIAIRTA
jgi:hypothetical protein